MIPFLHATKFNCENEGDTRTHRAHFEPRRRPFWGIAGSVELLE